MLDRMRSHPFPVVARFDLSLVLTYALPADRLRPLLGPGLELDTFGDLGFLAVALVQTRGLRPAFLPRFLGRDFFLSGYRVFARYRTRGGRRLRGLRILRSDTDRRTMALMGNLWTRYHYSTVDVKWERQGPRLAVAVDSRDGATDLRLTADLDRAELPAGSPFDDVRQARRFAGPLPFTFSPDRRRNAMVLIEGVRQGWEPRLVTVEVERCAFLERFAADLDGDRPGDPGPVLASAFVVEGIDYRWKRGRREALP